MRSCDLPLEDLIAYAEGGSHTAQKELVEAHLGGCAKCRERLQAFSEVDRTLRDGSPLRDDPVGRAAISARLEGKASRNRRWISGSAAEAPVRGAAAAAPAPRRDEIRGRASGRAGGVAGLAAFLVTVVIVAVGLAAVLSRMQPAEQQPGTGGPLAEGTPQAVIIHDHGKATQLEPGSDRFTRLASTAEEILRRVTLVQKASPDHADTMAAAKGEMTSVELLYSKPGVRAGRHGPYTSVLIPVDGVETGAMGYGWGFFVGNGEYTHLAGNAYTAEMNSLRQAVGLAALPMPGPGQPPAPGSIYLPFVSEREAAIPQATATLSGSGSSKLQVRRPEESSTEPAPFPPIVPPAGEEQYRSIDPAQAARESGLAIAYLRQPPVVANGTVEVDVNPQSFWADPEEISFALRSMVRYRGGGRTVLVLLTESSPGAAQREPVTLGDRTITLADGREAWVSTHPNWPQGNAVITVVDRYIVTVASDLPLEEVQKLANGVVVLPPSGSASERGIPADWPTPVAEQPATVGADIAVSGSVDIGGSSDRPQISYHLDIGNRGTDTANDLQLLVEFSPILAAHALDARPPQLSPQPHGSVGPGAQLGHGGTVTFDTSGTDPAQVQKALSEGIRVHVTWTEDGRLKKREFQFR